MTSIGVHNGAPAKVRALHSGCGCKNPRSASNLYELANGAIANSRRNNVPNLMVGGGSAECIRFLCYFLAFMARSLRLNETPGRRMRVRMRMRMLAPCGARNLITR